MKRYIIICLISLLATGCVVKKNTSPVLARVNNYEITQAEFEKEYKDSPYSRNDTPESRKQFLDTLIDRKLILQDAQKRGLDKKDEFLGSIERFWEQSLLKVAIENKTKDIAGSAVVNDKAVEKAYERMVKDGKTTRPYHEMYGQIKWEITKLKESQLMDAWVQDLHMKADIKIDYDRLKAGK